MVGPQVDLMKFHEVSKSTTPHGPLHEAFFDLPRPLCGWETGLRSDIRASKTWKIPMAVQADQQLPSQSTGKGFGKQKGG